MSSEVAFLSSPSTWYRDSQVKVNAVSGLPWLASLQRRTQRKYQKVQIKIPSARQTDLILFEAKNHSTSWGHNIYKYDTFIYSR